MGTILNMYIGLHVKYPLFLSLFNDTWILFSTYFQKILKYKFLENAFCGSRVAPYGRTDWRTDMAMLIVTFRTFKSPNKRVLWVDLTQRDLLSGYVKLPVPWKKLIFYWAAWINFSAALRRHVILVSFLHTIYIIRNRAGYNHWAVS